MSETVTISKKRHDRLCRVEAELNALHAGGVDNWDWYSESLRDAGLLDDEEEDDDE
jgi:hypothetical protein